jgi:hypothetical protein
MLERQVPPLPQCVSAYVIQKAVTDTFSTNLAKNIVFAIVEYEIIRAYVRVKQSHYRPVRPPEGSRRLSLPDFKTIGV